MILRPDHWRSPEHPYRTPRGHPSLFIQQTTDSAFIEAINAGLSLADATDHALDAGTRAISHLTENDS